MDFARLNILYKTYTFWSCFINNQTVCNRLIILVFCTDIFKIPFLCLFKLNDICSIMPTAFWNRFCQCKWSLQDVHRSMLVLTWNCFCFFVFSKTLKYLFVFILLVYFILWKLLSKIWNAIRNIYLSVYQFFLILFVHSLTDLFCLCLSVEHS